MKLLTLLMTTVCLQVSATGFGQTVTLSLENAPLEKVFKEVKKQTNYSFVYTRAQLKNTVPITFRVSNGQLKDVLEQCFLNQPLSFIIEDRYIVVRTKTAITQSTTSVIPPIDIAGKVINENGEALAGVTVTAKNSGIATSTNENGEFLLKAINDDDVIVITSIGYHRLEIPVNKETNFLITLKITVGRLDETIVIAYGTTTRRLNTGSIGKVTASDIGKQPVSNPLATLQGRIPGLLITQSSGIPGASFQVQVRGRNSIAQGNDPLIIIDGVPFAANNTSINQVAAAFSFDGNGLSPMNAINPADIEHIEILKDADATAIYGSRGSNGVILITTKKAQMENTRLDCRIYNGFSSVGRITKMLTTSQYLEMRREAFRNDGITPTASNAYDLLVWDTTRYTDLANELIGGTAISTNAQISFSGGSSGTKFLINSGYNRETTVYPGDFYDRRISFHFNVNHVSPSKKLSLNLTGNYSNGNNNIITNDLAKYINLPPNLPQLYDGNRNLNWNSGGFSFTNPFSFLKQSYSGRTENFVSSIVLQYKLLTNLAVKANFGYNSLNVHETSTTPISSRNPANNPTGSAQFGNTELKGLIIEPLIESFFKMWKGKLDLLIGASWQQNISNTFFLLGTGYTNDALIESPSAAANLSLTSTQGKYRYGAVFGRVSYNLQNRYLLNATMRRDGSSRFGPGRQYANFGAIGIGWIFSNERFFKKILPIINYGKIRGSYGTAGNDNIGDYQYLDRYKSTIYSYQNNPGIYPVALFNPDYSWEVNRKFESAIELGFFENRILVTANFYRNRSSNQLIQYSLPAQTGFTGITRNFPALIQNTGIELELSSIIFKKENFTWSSSINISFPKNKLLHFPELENSSYRNQYLEGYSLNIGNGFYFSGVNPQTGIYEFRSINGALTSTPAYPADFIKGLATLDPVYFGGFQNLIRYDNWQVDFHFEFRKQTGISYLYNFINTPAGTRFNQPDIVLERWQKPGYIAAIQRYTTTVSNPAYQANNQINFYGAENKYTDASYLRLKNISIAFEFSETMLKRIKLKQCRFFIQGQNIFTITNYYGGDPETQNALRLPPLRTIAVGFNVTF